MKNVSIKMLMRIHQTLVKNNFWQKVISLKITHTTIFENVVQLNSFSGCKNDTQERYKCI